MAPIPSSNLSGHRVLHERVTLALDRCQESQGVDFKESAPWTSLKWRITKTTLAMGNLRDGGIIIVGVSERGDSWEIAGISEEDRSTYDVDTIIDQTNSFVSPHADLAIVILEYHGKKFLTLQVNEFLETPLVCKKNGPAESGLVEGAVYLRTPGMARTTRITNASQMHDLLELAAEKRARRILEVGRRVGLAPAISVSQEFDKELDGL